ncbi:MAG: diguanylate cyclase [Acidimicrobiales bacterium]|nr:diguanylate cyclase [Acidimicrobiales bacterium]MCB1249047.1 diguanylate cyclase [Acidimicrobiales bacterium]
MTLVLGLLLTGVSAAMVRQSAEDDARAKFLQDVDQTTAAVQTQIDRYLARINDIGAFVAHDPTASQQTYRSYVEDTNVFTQLRGVVGVFFLHLVPEDQIDAFVARSTEASPEFAFLLLETTHPAGEPYYVLSYYAPGAVDLQLPVGTDARPIDSVRELVEASRASGDAVAGSFQDDPLIERIAQETEYEMFSRMLELDFFMGVPISGPSPDGTGEEFIGWSAATIDDFGTVLADATPDAGDLGMRLTIDLTDTGGNENLTRATLREGSAGAADQASFSAMRDLNVRGVDWHLEVWAGPDAAPTPLSVPVIVLAGIVGSLLAAGLMFLRVRAHDRERLFAAAMADTAQMQQAIVDSVSDAMVVVDADGKIASANPAWRGLWHPERPADDGLVGDLGHSYLARMAPAVRSARSALDAGVHGVLDGSMRVAETDVALEQGSRRRWFAVRVTPLRSESGGAVIVHTDITERKRSQDELELKASHDPLTGLLNRSAFEGEVAVALQQARVTGASVAVIFMDLDGFKPINDTHGHAVGDDVLRAVAQRIAGAVRTSDRVARLGGDEFVALLAPLPDPDVAEATADRIRRALAHPVHVEGAALQVRASLGVAIAEAPLGLTTEALIGRADEAMYAAKQSGGDQVTRAD